MDDPQANGIVEYSEHLIGGRWVAARSGRVIECVDPSSGKVWATAPEADVDDVEDAVQAARTAFASRSWSGASAADRGAILTRISDLMIERISDLARLETRDGGLTIRDATAMVERAAGWFRYYGGMADKIYGATIPADPSWHAYTLREPLGVVAAILPWNAPILMFSWKVAPALAAGNAMVVKSAEQTPITAFELASIAAEAGVPDGILNVITGYGESTGAALVRHPGVAKVSFTGEHRTAAKIAAAAAPSLKKLSFECGGKAPHIVFPDADLDLAIPNVVGSAFRMAGQTCALGSRVFLHAEVYDEALERLLELSSALVTGNPFESSSDIGPQAHADQLEKTLSYIDVGVGEGAEVVQGGERLAGPTLSEGYFVAPTVMVGVSNKMRVAQEEIFGPVASIIRFEDEADLITQANDVIYGLTAGVWTGDVSRAHRLARLIEAGSVWINVYPATHPAIPFGGVKMSGYGREHGEAAIHEYTAIKSVVIGGIETSDV